jgi:hypothetical protein
MARLAPGIILLLMGASTDITDITDIMGLMGLNKDIQNSTVDQSRKSHHV